MTPEEELVAQITDRCVRAAGAWPGQPAWTGQVLISPVPSSVWPGGGWTCEVLAGRVTGGPDFARWTVVAALSGSGGSILAALAALRDELDRELNARAGVVIRVLADGEEPGTAPRRDRRQAAARSAARDEAVAARRLTRRQRLVTRPERDS